MCTVYVYCCCVLPLCTATQYIPSTAGSALVQALQSLVSRNTDPLDSTVVSVTRFNAGHADNILPEKAVLGGTVRSLTPELREKALVPLQRMLDWSRN